MELMYMRRDFFEAHWNCSTYNASLIPVHEKTHKIYGGFIFIVSVFFLLIYVPCIYAMTRKQLIANSCYMIMVQMALFDMVTVPITGLISGYLSYFGIMYCDAPRFNHFLGTVLLGCWMAYSWAAVILALNRIAAITERMHYFAGRRIYLWMCLPYAVGIYSIICGVPVSYNPMFGAWYFNPFIESVEDREHFYTFPVHTADNVIFSFSLPLIYGLFFLKNRKLLMNKSRSKTSRKDFSLFLQTIIISACITVAAIAYLVMQFFPVPLWVSTISHATWLLVQGSPPVVYLTMNRSIRRVLLSVFTQRVGPATSVMSTDHSQQETGKPSGSSEGFVY